MKASKSKLDIILATCLLSSLSFVAGYRSDWGRPETQQRENHRVRNHRVLSEETRQHHAHHDATTVTVSQTSDAHDATMAQTEEVCDTCDNARRLRDLSEDEIRALKLERIKAKILQKLRLTQRPPKRDASALPSFPEELLEKGWHSEPHMNWQNDQPSPESDIFDFYGKLESVTTFGEIVGKCPRSRNANGRSVCLKFDFKGNSPAPEMVARAELWVYKIPDGAIHNQTLRVTELGGPHATKITRRGKLAAVKETDIGHGWVKFDIKHTVHRWMRRPNVPRAVDIECKSCRDLQIPIKINGPYKAFVVTYIGYNPKSHRHRRNAQILCTPGESRCCRESLYVNFTEFGWSDWLLQPKGYWSNDCSGHCRDPELLVYHQSDIQRKLRGHHRNHRTATLGTPCCHPIRTSAVTILYIDEDNSAKTETVPGMRIDACGCS